MAVCVRRIRQKMEPKMIALEMLTPARDTFVALSRVTCRHDLPNKSLQAGRRKALSADVDTKHACMTVMAATRKGRHYFYTYPSCFGQLQVALLLLGRRAAASVATGTW